MYRALYSLSLTEDMAKAGELSLRFSESQMRIGDIEGHRMSRQGPNDILPGSRGLTKWENAMRI